MSKKLLFAAIASILTLNAFADSKTITTQDYVDNKFQTKIPATVVDEDLVDYWGSDVTKTLVATTDTPGQVGQMGIVALPWDSSAAQTIFPDYNDYLMSVSVIPTYAEMLLGEYQIRRDMQLRISKSGHNSAGSPYGTGDAQYTNQWLNADIKGTGLVTKTSQDGQLGERKIFEASDLSGYSALTGNNKAIADISIPTVGAMMTAISNNQVTLPTGTAGNVVTYNSNGAIGGSVATYNGSGTYNASTDAGKIATAAAVETKQNKMTCTRYVENAEQTDENCLLWSIN